MSSFDCTGKDAICLCGRLATVLRIGVPRHSLTKVRDGLGRPALGLETGVVLLKDLHRLLAQLVLEDNDTGRFGADEGLVDRLLDRSTVLAWVLPWAGRLEVLLHAPVVGLGVPHDASDVEDFGGDSADTGVNVTLRRAHLGSNVARQVVDDLQVPPELAHNAEVIFGGEERMRPSVQRQLLPLVGCLLYHVGVVDNLATDHEVCRALVVLLEEGVEPRACASRSVVKGDGPFVVRSLVDVIGTVALLNSPLWKEAKREGKKRMSILHDFKSDESNKKERELTAAVALVVLAGVRVAAIWVQDGLRYVWNLAGRLGLVVCVDPLLLQARLGRRLKLCWVLTRN